MNCYSQIVFLVAFVLMCLEIIRLLLSGVSILPAWLTQASLTHTPSPPRDVLLWYPVNSRQTKPRVSLEASSLSYLLFFHLP